MKDTSVGYFTHVSRAFKAARHVYSASKMRATQGVGYDIAVSGRTRRNMGIISGLVASADRHLTKSTLAQLREICRAHDRQNSLFSGILNRALDNIFGDNFDFIPSTGDRDLNKRIKDYITARMDPQVCDATGVRGFDDIAKTAIRAVWNDGDCLLVKRSDGSLLCFEADQIETPSVANSTDNIVLGIEMNTVNRHLAYHVRQRSRTGRNVTVSERLIAANGFMPAWRTRYNQTRGVPFLAAILSFFDRTDGYLDNESFAAQLNATGGFKITKENTDNDMSGIKTNEESSSDNFEKVQEFLPGWIWEGGVGEDIDMVLPQRPGDNFEPYIITCCRIIGVGIGYPLELLMLDFSKTNYSSARASMGEARRMFRGWQKYAGRQICMPWYRWQIARAIAAGQLPARPEAFKVRCQWPAWEYIDPMKEANANKIAILNRTKSISQCIRERGDEPDEVFEEISEEQKKLAALGVSLQQEKPSADKPEDIEPEDVEPDEPATNQKKGK